ncbi:MAG: D-alanyl-D-alanine endopeptidase, partial [Steroidobacteraceae bacterium]
DTARETGVASAVSALPQGPAPAAAVTRPVPRLTPAKLDVRSASVLVMDAADSSVLYSKHAQKVVPIASITKLMTALVVLEANQPLDEIIEVTPADRHRDKGAHSRLPVGTRLSRGDLLQLALMSSENRAAQAVAREYPGGVAECLRAMNAKAKALGMKTARFADPTGLSSENVSSAADLTKLVAAAAQDPVISKFSTYQSHAVPVGKHLLEFRNTNTLVSKPDWTIMVQKTGYTNDAGQCLVMETVIQERPVLIVLLNSFGKLTRVADARRIRKWMEMAPHDMAPHEIAPAAAQSLVTMERFRGDPAGAEGT